MQTVKLQAINKVSGRDTLEENDEQFAPTELLSHPEVKERTKIVEKHVCGAVRMKVTQQIEGEGEWRTTFPQLC